MVDRKTRTSTAHGPTAAKKPYKAALPPKTAAKPVSKPAAPPPKKRKADEDPKPDEPDRPRVPSTILNLPEEVDFPRGGGTNLTQVEVREAQLEGEKEARDEESALTSNTEVVKDKSKAKRRKLERELAGAIKPKNVLPKDAFRVEHLNYKRLVPTTKLLAQIVLVRPLELIVSLPNQLYGHIPITNISVEYTTRLEEEGEDSSEEESEEESENEEAKPATAGLPSLNQLFKVGEYVSAIVVSSATSDSKVKMGGRTGDETVRAAQRIELSTEPEKVNEGIAKGDLRTGFTLTASVRSVEDHGYVLNLGLPSLTSFVSFKEAKKLQPTRLQIGQLVSCRVKEMGENGRTCTVTVGRAEVTGSTLGNASSIASILPATLVTALITATLSSGLNVKFFGYFDGTIDLFHLNGLNPETDFKVGQKIKARVLWDSIGSTPKKFSLSLASHILQMGVARVDAEEGVQGDELVDRFPVGRVLEQVRVVRMDDEWGLTCEILDGEDSVPAFVHISRITDDHLATVPKAGPWKASTIHRGRVIGYSALDGLVQLSFQPSIIEQSFLRVSDVKVGEVIKGTVKRLTETALFVSISGNVDGVVWPIHYNDVKLKHPEKKFKVGASVKARIYSADSEKNRVVLTLKRALVTSELPIIAEFEDAKVGVVTHGTVSKIMDAGIIVDFFGGLRALVPSKEAAEGFTADLSRVFTVGRVIPVRIIGVDVERQRIVASARQAASSFTKPGEISSVEIGTVLKGEITGLHETNIVLALEPSRIKALMSYSTLARHRKVSIDDLKLALDKKQILEDLVVVSKNVDKGFVIVGLVPSKAAKTVETEVDPVHGSLTFESLAVGQIITGRVSSRVPTGLLVQISRSLKGRVPPTEVSDDFEAAKGSALAIGAHVACYVLKIDTEFRRVELSLRASRINKDVLVKDPIVSSVEELKVGQSVRGFVKNVANAGLFVALGGDITARVQIKELFDEFVKEWKPRFSVGQLVEGKITAVNKETSQVELSLRKSATTKKAQLVLADIAAGQVVKGVVSRVEAYGAFIRIDGSNLSGLCHKSNVTDDESTAWTEFIHAGDKVRTMIISINAESSKIAVGIKESLFVDAVPEDEAEVVEAEAGDELEGSEDDDEEEIEEIENEDDSDEEMEAPQASTSKLTIAPKAKVVPLAVASGFDWEGNDEDAQAEEEEEDSDEEAIVVPSKVSHQDLSTLEDRTGDLASQAPTTVADFERLLLGSPNSSYLWIQYIAFYLGLSQTDKAREMGQRALKSIHYREELEKLNVWVALLNLENTYGTEASLDAMFKEAVQSNDAKTVYLRLVDIYERSAKFEAEEELFQRLVKKFGQSSKAWTLFGQFYLTRGRPTEARDLLPRSLKSLEKRKHVKTISKFAQLEFKLGDAERGRTIFEGIMDSYPKRLDLWFVYIDMEVKQANVMGVRALFDRVLGQRLSSKKGKSVFKKWLAFEKEHGDEAGIERVKDQARAFVESRQEE